MNLITINQDQNNKILKVKIDDLITIRLKENPSTGYRWKFGELDKKIIEIEGSEYIHPSNKGIGSGGMRTFTFRAKSLGKTKVQLQLKREWEKDKDPFDQFTLFIHII